MAEAAAMAPRETEPVGQCLLCAAPDSRPFDRRADHGHLVSNRLCLRCGLVYQSPRMTPAALEAFYQREYRALYQGAEGPARKDLLVQSGRAETLLRFVAQHMPPPSRHLDIGASAGVLAVRFQEYFGYTSIGVEPGDAYRSFAQARGLQVYPSLEALAAAGEARFDLITMAHVLEHLPDPLGYLTHLRETWLNPDGWLLVEVPNLYGHNCFEVAHLVSFSPHTLRQTVQQAGFEVAHLQAHGQPRSVVLPLYLTLIARPGMPPQSLRPERGVSLKRRLGMLRKRALERLVPELAWLPMP